MGEPAARASECVLGPMNMKRIGRVKAWPEAPWMKLGFVNRDSLRPKGGGQQREVRISSPVERRDPDAERRRGRSKTAPLALAVARRRALSDREVQIAYPWAVQHTPQISFYIEWARRDAARKKFKRNVHMLLTRQKVHAGFLFRYRGWLSQTLSLPSLL
jgi:hypothetical protein